MLANEVLSFIEENDVKFIRLAFTDLFGQLRNTAILPDQLAAAMESGVAIDATAVPGCACAPGGRTQPGPHRMYLEARDTTADGAVRLTDIRVIFAP